MLRSRIITGLVLAACAFAAFYLLPPFWYALLFWGVAGLGAYEFAALAGLGSRLGRALYVVAYTVLVVVSAWWAELQAVGLWLGAAVWVLAVLTVLAYPASAAVIRRGWLTGVLGILICWAAWIALVVIRAAPDGAHWMVWLGFLVVGADAGAFFAGRWFGASKLAPALSPGKTWEGFWGGLATASLVCGFILLLMGRFNAGWLLIMVLLVAVAVFGDLFESALKRVRGLKDSGSLLPGHGGVLDRFDSAVAVLPCLALILIHGGLSNMG
jgi:phosphatidate cytidylyltransferase